MKLKFSITQGFLMIMLLILLLVSAVGFITYRDFVKVLDNAKESGKPDPTVAMTKNVIYSVTEAENKVKTFTLTEDTLFLNQYRTIRSNILDQLSTLDTMELASKKDDAQLDTLSKYVSYKLEVYDSLLVLQNEYRVQQALERVNETIEGAVEEVDASVPQSAKSQKKEEETEEERRFLFFKLKKKKNRNKRRNNDNEEEDDDDSNIAANVPKEMRVNYETVKNNLAQIQSSETSREEQQLLQEYELLELDKLYSAHLSSILADLENKGLKRDKIRAQRTREIVSKANVQIIIFCVLISILLLITSYTIIRYISRSTRYRKVLKRAKNEAESLAQAKEHFVATVSHEIRTPMNIISGFTEQLSHSELNQQQRDQLETVIKASSHLLQLINEVLDFTKLQNYKLELETRNFRLRETLNEVRDLMTPLAEEKDIELEFIVLDDTPDVILGDAIRLSQILINVTSNAVKFTDKGIVSVTVTPLQVGEKIAILEFSIADTGIGMSPEKLERVFEAFEQADASTSRTYGGTGLGLSITKKLIELHNGTVQVHSKENVGTEIIIEIPYALGEITELEEAAPTSSFQPIVENTSILVADDEAFNRKLIATILGKFGVKMTEAENGKDAVKLSNKNKFDIILMDARMPEMNGTEAAVAIRQNGKNKETPIIALSAAITDEDKKSYINAGMNAVLGKPFRESQLLSVIAEQLITQKMDVNDSSSEGLLDFEGLKALSGQDESFYVEMLETFIRGTENGLAEMKKLLEGGEIKRMGEIAHRISAPCKHLEATQLYNVLKQIENQSKTESPSTVELESLLEKATKMGEKVITIVESELVREKEV
ncbi:MAG: ATP-binding protein [bacterium]|nr:ATP-binding protein [bacterium]